MRRGFGLRWRAAFEREDDLANFDLLAFLDFDLFDDAADRRGNLDDGLVGLQFHHRLAFGNLRAGSDHQADEIALVEIFSPSSGSLNSLAPGGRRGGHGWSRG